MLEISKTDLEGRTEKLTELSSVRLSESEARALEQTARRLNITVSCLLRRLVLQLLGVNVNFPPVRENTVILGRSDVDNRRAGNGTSQEGL